MSICPCLDAGGRLRAGCGHMKISCVLTAVVPLIFLAACASVVEGTNKTLHVSSRPSGALIKLDGATRAITPGVIQVSTRTEHTVCVELPGYVPYSVRVTRKISPWEWGNIFTGGAPGVAFDALTGAVYRLEPSHIDAELQRIRK